MKFIGKSKVVAKSFFISLPFLIPLCLMFFFIVQFLSDQITKSQLQIKGLEYVLESQKLLKVAQEHRVKAQLFLVNPTPYNRASVLQSKGELDVVFNMLQTSNRVIGKELKTTGYFNELEKKWEDLSVPSASLSPLKNAEEQTKFIENSLLPFISLIANNSYLPYELDAVSYYAAEMFIYKLPQLAEAIGRVQAFGIPTLDNTKIEESEKVFLNVLLSLANVEFQSLKTTFELFIKKAPHYESRLKPFFLDLEESVNQFFSYINDNLFIDDAKPTIPITFSNEAGFPLESLAKLSLYNYEALKEMLNAKLLSLNKDKLRISLLFIFSLLLSTFIFYRVFNVISNLMVNVRDSSTYMISSIGEIRDASLNIATEALRSFSSVTDLSTNVGQASQVAKTSIERGQVFLDEIEILVRNTENGKKSNEDIVSTIFNIHEQVLSIQEIIHSLNKQSQTIGGIIVNVEEISRQSNLLALNASLEAIKAGDQGKGFDVVAQEINRLSLQSHQATIHIRLLLDEIREVILRAVKVTELGKNTVTEGVQQSSVARQSFTDLTLSILNAQKAAEQIVNSNKQHFLGIEHIDMSIKGIRRASSQNTDKINGLEKAIRNLNNIGVKLKEIIEGL
jgi:methyl-accepting chemotaxis protein